MNHKIAGPDLEHAQTVAVCSWSMLPTDPKSLLASLQRTGIGRVQLALDPLREAPAAWKDAGATLRGAGIEIVSGMFGCVGEDYSTLESIRATGGIVPDATWDRNLDRIRTVASIAAGLGLKLTTFHAGFIPADDAAPGFSKLLDRLAVVADLFSAEGIRLGLETGQETASALIHLLDRLNRPNVGVNFDPANLLLYDKDDPIRALRVLGPRILQVHIKDARRPQVPGTWGEEVVAGTGEVDWSVFFAALEEKGFAGNFVIEREAGEDRLTDIIRARELVRKYVGTTGPICRS